MTNAAWQRGCMNALICGVGVLGVIGVLTFGISATTGRTLRDSGAMAFAVFWVAIFTAFVSTFLIGRRKRGAILLDCGHHPTRALFLLNAAIFGFLGLGGGFASNTFDSVGIASALFGITFSVYFVFMSFGRLQIVENGIWQYWSLLKWQKLESYEWQGQSTATLMLQAKTKLPFFGRGALPVPAEHKAAVTKLLEQYAAQKDA
jgi:hypothetical protein